MIFKWCLRSVWSVYCAVQERPLQELREELQTEVTEALASYRKHCCSASVSAGQVRTLCTHVRQCRCLWFYYIAHSWIFWVSLTIRTALCASCSWFFLSICELFLFTSTAWGRVKCCCQAWGAPSISACSSAARCCAWTPAALPHTSTLCCCLWSVPSTHGSLSYMSFSVK